MNPPHITRRSSTQATLAGQFVSRSFVVLLRKSLPQNYNLQTAAELSVIQKYMKEIKYPFIPKSTAYMLEGHIISLPLSNGKFACGRVLQFMEINGRRESKHFLIGLMNWCSQEPPNETTNLGSSFIDHGQVHVKTINECGAEISGFRALSADEIDIPLSLDQAPGKNCGLRKGFLHLGLASEQQQMHLQVFSTWGYSVFKLLAEKHFARV